MGKLIPRQIIDERNEKVRMYGEYYLDYFDMERYFDPFRLKILMLPKDGSNPNGKNPDFFFCKGIDYLSLRDYQSAIKNFEKGVTDKITHYLCRFNLGYALFKIGHYQAASQHYQILSDQCDEKIHPVRHIPGILYNKAVCELQSGYYDHSAMTAEKCIALLKEIEKQKGGSVLKLEKHQQEMMVDMY